MIKKYIVLLLVILVHLIILTCGTSPGSTPSSSSSDLGTDSSIVSPSSSSDSSDSDSSDSSPPPQVTYTHGLQSREEFEGHQFTIVDGAYHFPQLLSELGIFKDFEKLTVNEGVIPYGVNSPLYTSGATKRRWMILPSNTDKIVYNLAGATNVFKFPVGTVFIKTFSLTNAENEEIHLETRFIIENGAQGIGADATSYRWKKDQTDAVLMTANVDEAVNVSDDYPTKGTGIVNWHYPFSECSQCHILGGKLLGVVPSQLNGEFYYDRYDVTDNQIRTWNSIELFNKDMSFHYPYSQEDYRYDHVERYDRLDDESVDLNQRIKSYLAVNCGICHRPEHPHGYHLNLPSNLDFRYEVPIPQMALYDTVNDTKIPADRGHVSSNYYFYRVDTDDLTNSVLYGRLSHDANTNLKPGMALFSEPNPAILSPIKEWLRINFVEE